MVCDRVPGNGAVSLNGIKIGDAVTGLAFQGDATATMLPRNCVRIELQAVGDADLGEVGLEFRTN